MAKVQRGVVTGPNQTNPGNRLDSCGPMGKGSGDVGTRAPNNQNKTARVNSCGPMSRTHPGMPNPNEKAKFSVEHARDGYDPPAVVSPGRGSVPVNPFSGNTYVPAHLLRDSAKK